MYSCVLIVQAFLLLVMMANLSQCVRLCFGMLQLHWVSVRAASSASRCPQVLRTLIDVLTVKAAAFSLDEEVGFADALRDQGMDLVRADGLPQDALDLVFFSVIDQNPSNAIRTRLSGQ